MLFDVRLKVVWLDVVNRINLNNVLDKPVLSGRKFRIYRTSPKNRTCRKNGQQYPPFPKHLNINYRIVKSPGRYCLESVNATFLSHTEQSERVLGYHNISFSG